MSMQTLIRTYKGKADEAAAAFQQDAAALAGSGYQPVAQNYVAGSWSAGAFIIALLLCLFLVGILVFIYMLLVKPAGTLTVTYALMDPSAPPLPAPTWTAQSAAPAGSKCGNCGKSLSPAWRGRCGHCRKSYTEFTPVVP